MDEREAIRKSLSYLRAPAGTLDAVLDKIEQEEAAEAPAPVPISTAAAPPGRSGGPPSSRRCSRRCCP